MRFPGFVLEAGNKRRSRRGRRGRRGRGRLTEGEDVAAREMS
jgi:hypothetical protein